MGGRRKTPERAKSANTSIPPRPFTETHAVPRRPRTPERARDAFFRARAPPRARDEAAWRVRRLRAPRAPILSPFERQLVKPPFERLVRHPATSTPPSRPRASRARGARGARADPPDDASAIAQDPHPDDAHARVRDDGDGDRGSGRGAHPPPSSPSDPATTAAFEVYSPRPRRAPDRRLPDASPPPPLPPPASPRAARRDIHRGRRVRRGVPRPGSSGRVSAPGASPDAAPLSAFASSGATRNPDASASPSARVRRLLTARSAPSAPLAIPDRAALVSAPAPSPRRALRPLSRGGGPAARPRARGCRRARHASPIRRGRVPSHGARRARRRRRARSRERLSIVRATRARLLQRRRREGQTPRERAKVSAPPGYSEHHTGYAVDISTPELGDELSVAFERTAAFRWLAANARDARVRDEFREGPSHRGELRTVALQMGGRCAQHANLRGDGGDDEASGGRGKVRRMELSDDAEGRGETRLDGGRDPLCEHSFARRASRHHGRLFPRARVNTGYRSVSHESASVASATPTSRQRSLVAARSRDATQGGSGRRGRRWRRGRCRHRADARAHRGASHSPVYPSLARGAPSLRPTRPPDAHVGTPVALRRPTSATATRSARPFARSTTRGRPSTTVSATSSPRRSAPSRDSRRTARAPPRPPPRARDAPAPVTPDLLARRWAQRVALARGELAVAAYLNDAANAREAVETRAHLHRVDRDNAARLADDHRRRVDETVALSPLRWRTSNRNSPMARERRRGVTRRRAHRRAARSNPYSNPNRRGTRPKTTTSSVLRPKNGKRLKRNPSQRGRRRLHARETGVGDERDDRRVLDAKREATAACETIVARSKMPPRDRHAADAVFSLEAREKRSRLGAGRWIGRPILAALATNRLWNRLWISSRRTA